MLKLAFEPLFLFGKTLQVIGGLFVELLIEPICLRGDLFKDLRGEAGDPGR